MHRKLSCIFAVLTLGAAAGCAGSSDLVRQRPTERVYHTHFGQTQYAVVSAMQISKFHILDTKEIDESEVVYSGYYYRTGTQRRQRAEFQVYVRDLGEDVSMVRIEVPSPTQYGATSPAIVVRRFFDALEKHPGIAASLQD